MSRPKPSTRDYRFLLECFDYHIDRARTLVDSVGPAVLAGSPDQVRDMFESLSTVDLLLRAIRRTAPSLAPELPVSPWSNELLELVRRDLAVLHRTVKDRAGKGATIP